MRFLSIFIFFEGVFRAHCSFRDRPSIENKSAIVVEEDKCPDEHLQIECESICRLEFNRCRLLCETEYCQSICDREYDNCRNGCPCGADCKEGCIHCGHPLCPVGILVMSADVNEAFSISFDGQTSTKATISAPRDDYLELAPHALIKNELYIFGGQNTMKIAKLVGCEWVEQVQKLINPMKQESAALTIDNGNKALICFQYSMSPQRCEIFDTTISVYTNSTRYPHGGGKLAFYKGQPLTVGNSLKTYENIVETLKLTDDPSSSGWSTLDDFPGRTGNHFLIGLPSGSVLLAGGGFFEGNDWFSQTAIWLLQDEIWTQIGDLQNADARGSAIMYNDSIFLVSGYNDPYAIVRLDFEGDEMVNQEIIGNTVSTYLPVLFLVPADFCV